MIRTFGRMIVCSEKRTPEIVAEMFESMTIQEKAEFLTRIGGKGFMTIRAKSGDEEILSHVPLDFLLAEFCG